MNIDDIYSDIVIDNDQSSSDSEKDQEPKQDKILQDRIKELEDINQLNLKEIENLKQTISTKTIDNENILKQNEQTKKINEILMKNISCLFKTSLLEIQRKEKEINNLRDEISNKNQSSSNNNNNNNKKLQTKK